MRLTKAKSYREIQRVRAFALPASEMVRRKEYGAEDWVHLHIIPTEKGLDTRTILAYLRERYWMNEISNLQILGTHV